MRDRFIVAKTERNYCDATISVGSLTGILLLLSVITGCGLPEPPNIPKQMSETMIQLGVWPIYSWRESVNVGDVYLVDTSVRKGTSISSVDFPTYLVTKALADRLETYRARRLAPDRRFPVSATDLNAQVAPGQQGRGHYRQVAPTKDGRTPLELATFPGFSLASIDDVTGAASVPGLFSSFIGSLGFRRSVSLEVKPGAVEIAQISADDYVAAISLVCSDRTTPFGNRDLGVLAAKFAHDNVFIEWDRRYQENKTTTAPFTPYLYIFTRVYYLRSIKYIYSDSDAYSAALSAALANEHPAGKTPVPAPNVVVNVSGTGASEKSVKNEDLAALKEEIASIRTAVSGGQNIQFGITGARATATGIELVDSFDRPLAFGYTAFGEKFQKGDDLSKICKEASIN